MYIYVILAVGLLFSLIAAFNNKEEKHVKGLLLSIMVYPLLFCIAKMNLYLQFLNGSFNIHTVNVLIVISMLSFLFIQLREANIKW